MESRIAPSYARMELNGGGAGVPDYRELTGRFDKVISIEMLER